jgi:hypothetical protein
MINKALDCGDISAAPFVVMHKKPDLYPQYCVTVNEKTGFAHWRADADAFSDDIYFNVRGDGVICKRVFKNKSKDVLQLKELGFRIDGADFGGAPRDDYFYHNENPRIYEVMTFPVDYNRTVSDAKNSGFDVAANNRWADPGVVSQRIGASPYQPFPAILVGNYKKRKGLVHGSLSQNIFYHNYLVNHCGGVRLDIFSSFKCVAYLEVQPERVLTDEWYLGRTSRADDIEKIFAEYVRVLREKLPANYGASKINRDNLTWGSWNDGIRRNVSQKMLLAEAEFLKAEFPTVKWMQLDDGYARYNRSAHGLGVPYEGGAGIDYAKFPEGLKGFADKLKTAGLRPALWIGGVCPVETKIYAEHPEWFIDYRSRMQDMQPLDVSIPDVREYMLSAVDVLCGEYGFESVKHDFWSYAFEDGGDLYANKTQSGYELRKWWLTELRKRLAADGYLQTGCDIVMGNPFLGEYFTNYRYGIDIGEGEWDNVKTNFLWGTACFATHTGDLFVPNSDAVGMLPGLNDTDAMFWINYCLITRTTVEIAGKLSLADKNAERLKVLRKAVCNPDNGRDVYFAGYDYRKPGYSVPEIIYFNTPHFSPCRADCVPAVTAGVFNVTDDPKTVFLKTAHLGLKKDDYILTDIWTGETYRGDNVKFVLGPHESKVFSINVNRGVQFLDADIRLNGFERSDARITCVSDYGAEAEFLFNAPPSAVTFNGEKLKFDRIGNKIKFAVPGEGKIQIKFKENKAK